MLSSMSPTRLYETYMNGDIKITHATVCSIFFVVFVLFVLSYLFKDSCDSCCPESFTFELTPEKKCDGGPYMYSSDPERQKLCAKFTRADLAQYECPAGYNGRHVRRADVGNGTLSNTEWKNPKCTGVY